MRVVLDASAALAGFTGQDGEAAFGAHDLVAPALLWSETTAELHAALRRGDITRATAEAALATIQRVVERHDEPSVHRCAWEIADRLGWGRTYDAEYVAVAQELGVPLLTLDRRLARGIANLVRVVSPADLGL